MTRFAIICAVLLACRAALTGNPVVINAPDFAMTSESVKVFVGADSSQVSGVFSFQLVLSWPNARSEKPGQEIEVPVFVPAALKTADEAISQLEPRVVLGERESAPTRAYFANPTSHDGLLAVPANVKICWFVFTFRPEELHAAITLTLRYRQPHYVFNGRTVAAYLPILPEHEKIKGMTKHTDEDFLVTFEAAPGVKLERITPHRLILTDTPERIAVRPEHRVNIAVAVRPEVAPETSSKTSPR